MQKKKIVIAGGSGFLGRTLIKWFGRSGRELVVLSRRPAEMEGARIAIWDGRTVGEWAKELDGAEALINLAGRSVDCRYHARNRRAVMDSRVDSTRALGEAICRCSNPPTVWLNSSTATIYKHTYGPAHDEQGEIGADAEAKDAFSIEVARAWEKEFSNSKTPSTRKVILRAAMVLGAEDGGVFQVLRRLTRLGLGGRMGHGRQFVSWIHAADFCRAVEWLLHNNNAEGIYNLSSPHPVTNSEMMATFRKASGVPFGLPAARWMLEIGAFFLRTETELIIKSRRVVPGRLLDEGFTFQFPHIEEAIEEIQRK
ncbi:MAG: TIGR01777 family oxidoreductase [Planctomycetota bacterium]|nr:TIGR01777 family oxidoreductase [Planctomycetota bacterium]